jgi:hydroxymethylbilane synthase
LSKSIRIATRRSQLALWQAEHVASLLRAAHPGLTVELVPMTTQGDRVQDRALAEVGGKGLFVKELEVAMQEGRADIAVHSMKDVPSELPPGFCITAALPRANARDAFISRKYTSFAALPNGARVGTSSPRRQAQLRHARRDLRLELLRGNVDTRLRRLDEGGLDAILLACAGLERLGIGHHVTEQLDLELSLPAVGQGVIGIECREDDDASRSALAALHHEDTYTRLRAERAFAATLGGSCHSPIAAHATLDQGLLTVRGFIGAPEGDETYRDRISGAPADAESLGRALAARMQSSGAETLLERLRREAAAQP